MKTQVRVLAMLLALLTVLAVFPVGAFASTWLDVQATTAKNEEAGTSSSVITVTVDGNALLSAAKGGGLSGIRSGITLSDLTDVISPEELLEWFPKESVSELVQDIIDDIGTERLLTYLDIAKLFASVDAAELVKLIKDIPGIETYVKDFDELMSYVATDDLLAAIDCIDLDKLLQDHVTDLVDLVLGSSVTIDNDKLLQAIDVERIVDDGIVTLENIIDVDAIQDVFDGLTDETVNFLLSDACAYVDVDKIVASISPDKLLSIVDYYVGDGRYWDVAKMLDDGIITVSAVIGQKLIDVDALLADTDAALNLDNLVNTDFVAGKPVSELKAFVKLPEVTALLQSKGFDTLKQYFAESALTALLSGKSYAALSAYLTPANYEKLLDETGMTYARLHQYFDDTKLGGLLGSFTYAELEGFLYTENLNALLGSLDYNALKNFLSIPALASYIRAHFDYNDLQAYADISVIATLVSAADYSALQPYVNESRVIDLVKAKDPALVADYVNDFDDAAQIISEETGTPLSVIAMTCSTPADLATNGYLTSAVITRMINENVISLNTVIFGDGTLGALLPVADLFADVTAVDKDLALFGNSTYAPLVTMEQILDTDGAADVNAIIFGNSAAALPQLITMKALYDAGIVDFQGMIFGSGANAAIVTLDTLNDTGVVKLSELVFGSATHAAIIGIGDLIEAGVIDIATVLLGDSAKGLDPLVTIDRLLDLGIINLQLAVNGDGASVPALLTSDELQSLIDVEAMLADHVITVSELLSSNAILAEELADAYGYEALLNMTAVQTKFKTLSPAILTRHIDATKTLQYFKDHGRTVSDLMKYLAGGSWDLKKLLSSDLISLSALIGFDSTAAVDVTALLADKTHFGSLKLTDVIDVNDLKAQLYALADKTVLINCVDAKKTVELVGIPKVVNTIGGYATLINLYVTDLTQMFNVIGLDVILTQIISDGKLNTLFDTNGLINAIGVEKLLSLVDISEIAKQLQESGALGEIISTLDLKKYAKYLVRVINNAEKKIESISIGSLLVAYKDDNDLLAFSARNLVQAMIDLIPKLSDMKGYQNGDTVFELNVHLTYKDNDDPTKILSKDVTLRVVLASGAERIASIARRVESLLDRYLTYSFSASSLTFDLKLPEKVSAGYAAVLAHLAESVPTLADKLVFAYDSTGAQLVSLADSVTVGELSDLLDSVDTARFTQAYNRVLGQRYVQILLSYIESATGYAVANLSLDDIVVRASSDLPTLHTVCEKVKEKTGFDVESRLPISSTYTNATPVELLRLLAERFGKEFDLQPILEEAVLDEQPFDYFYRAVSKKIDQSGEIFEAVKDRVLDYVNVFLSTSVGSKIRNVSLADIYRGSGVFSYAGSAAFRPKQLIEKALNKVMPRIRDRIGEQVEELIDTILSYFPEEEMTFAVDGTVRATNFYQATFYDLNNVKLRTAIVPVGQKLTDVCPFPEGTGAWIDAADATVVYTRMPAKDVSVIAAIVEPETQIDITLENGTLGEDYTVDLVGDTVLVTITDMGDTAVVNIPNEQLAALVNDDQKLVVTSADGKIRVSFDNAALAAILAQAAGRAISFSYNKLASGDYYGAESGAWYYDLTVLYDGVPEATSFAGCEVDVTLPFDAALTASVDSKTAVTTRNTDGKLEDLASVNTNVADKTVTFQAPHFSVYGVVNKYFLEWNEKTSVDQEGKASAEETLTEVLPVNPMTGGVECIPEGFYEAGHTFTLTGAQMGFDATAAYRWIGFSDGTNTYNAASTTFKMPAAATKLTHRVERIVYHVYYFVNGVLTGTVSYTYAERNDAKVTTTPALADGYDQWLGFDTAAIGAKDLYVFARPTTVTADTVYTFVFNAEDGTEVSRFSTTKADFASQTVPAVPAKAGFVGSWVNAKGVALDALLTYVWDTADVLQTLTATYKADVRYTISTEGVTVDPTSATAGETVTVTVVPTEGKTVKTVTVRSWADGSEQILTLDENGQATFTMPAGGVTVIANEETAETQYGTFSVTIKRGYKLVKNVEDIPGAPDGLTRISARITDAGDLVLTYRYVKTGSENIDAFVAKIQTTPMTVEEQYLIDGKLYGAEADAEGYLKDVDVAVSEWLKMTGTEYNVPAMRYEDKSDCTVCWIILAVVLFLILLIVLIYVLYITGKIGVNIFTKIATFIVSIFFAICVALYVAGVKIAAFFGFVSKDDKKDEGDKKGE